MLLSRSFLCVGNTQLILIQPPPPPQTKCTAIAVLVVEGVDVYLAPAHSLGGVKRYLNRHHMLSA